MERKRKGKRKGTNGKKDRAVDKFNFWINSTRRVNHDLLNVVLPLVDTYVYHTCVAETHVNVSECNLRTFSYGQ